MLCVYGPVAGVCVDAEGPLAGSCVPAQARERCASGLGSSPEASTRLEMTIVTTILIAGEGVLGEWKSRADDIVAGNWSIDWPSGVLHAPSKSIFSPQMGRNR